MLKWEYKVLKSVNGLRVLNKGEILYDIPIKNELVFATVTCNHLYILEDTSLGGASTDIDLETGDAETCVIKKGKRGEPVKWNVNKVK